MDKRIYIVGILAIILIGGGMFLSKSQKEGNDKKDENKKVEVKKIEIKKNKEEKNMTEENTQENKVVTTESGLQYEIIKMGDGQKPTATDTVEVHYEGKLENGEIFDSSYQRGEKISFPLNGVIAGWTEGLQLMPVGSKFKFIIPPELAYGPAGAGHPLSGKTLIFTVELFDIK